MMNKFTAFIFSIILSFVISSNNLSAYINKIPAIQDEKKKIKKHEGPPNILIIMTDQQRYDQMGYSSEGYFETPNLDLLAENGIIFENAYSSAPVCIPARCSILTGLYHHRTETRGLFKTLKEGFWTMPHVLRENGYQTALIGKMHFHPMRSDHGFEIMRLKEHLGMVYAPDETDDYVDWLEKAGKNDWRATHIFGPDQQKEKLEYQLSFQSIPFYYDQYYHPTNWIARETVKFLKSRDENKPYLLVVSFPHPHSPYDPPAPYDTMYNIEDAVLPNVDPDINSQLPPDAAEQMRTGTNFGGKILQKKIMTYIRALINQVDVSVGKIMEHVDMENTVVIFTTDHGDYYGNRGLMFKAPGIPFDDLAKVPFFVSGAGIPKGKRLSNNIQSADIALTCLDLAGVEPPSRSLFDTQSLVPFFAGENPPDDRVVFCTSGVNWPMIRYKEYKYFYNEPTGQEMLFNVVNDPSEKINLANDPKYAQALNIARKKMKEILNKGIPKLPHYN